MRTAAITVICLLVVLSVIAALALGAWETIGEVPISPLGLVALGLGAGLSFLLGAGLMALMFFSSRRGYDQRAHDAEPAAAGPRANQSGRRGLSRRA